MKLLFSEIIYSLRSNKINYILNVLIVSFISFLFIFSLYLLVQIHTRESAIKQMVMGKNMYDIQDTLYDDEFYNFRQDEANINNLADFYNYLNQSKISELISVFDQPLFINLEESNEQSNYNSNGEETVLEIESIQLNEQAFDFYNIQISEGNNFDWDSIKAEAYEIPVLLGSNYKEKYSINDIINVQYYMKNINIKVIGFVEKNNHIYYKGNAEFYLDSYIIIPYPKNCSSVLKNEKDDLFFKGILYFAMINANLASSNSQEIVEQDLHEISLLSEFNQYKLLGSTEFSKEYDQMIKVMEENSFLYILIIVFLMSGGIFIETLLSFEIIKKRMNIYILNRELGLQTTKKDFIITELVPCLFSSLISMYLIYSLFSDSFNYITMFLLVFFITFTIFIICYKMAYILSMKLIKGERKL